ncbi:ABC transporter ATP-binding protein [Gorillibacterium sp. sgz500922]|uniref:ABC transporter ATP-binding protein n=1 Tax=Gorillibacterium sp. sgz500922 TaxID=3446694 RepID=UPI003F672B85
METLLQAVGVARTYGSGSGSVQALKRADLSIPAGRLVALRGRSGSGKTTLLNLLAALDTPTEGAVYYKGRAISSLSDSERTLIRRREMGLIFQSYALIPLMSAYENVEFGLRVAGVPRREYAALAREALDYVGMLPRMKHRPFELSGGEQQRVAIARAIAHRPSLVLADEPTAELDSRMGLTVIKVFKDLVRDFGITVLLTTHDPAIIEIVDHVYTLEDGQLEDES